MANYSIWVLGESNISLTGGVTLDGITQGDGSHLVGEYLTINSKTATEVFIRDRGSETFFADNDGTQRLNGAQTIDGVTYSNNTRVEAEYTFVVRDTSTGIEYTVVAFNVNNSSPAYGTVEGLAFIGTVPPTGAPLLVVSAQEGPPNSGPNAFDASDYTPICFARDTAIATPTGPALVQDLAPGDTVLGHDGAPLHLCRLFRRAFGGAALAANPKLRPVRIRAGALGGGLPRRDLLVSRQHRMLVQSRIVQRMFGTHGALIPAIKLTALPGIAIDDTAPGVEYFHLLFDRHQVILAEGAPAESLFTGPEALKSISPEARAEILTIFPELRDQGHAPQPAAFMPAGRQQKQLIRRHAKNAKPVLETWC